MRLAPENYTEPRSYLKNQQIMNIEEIKREIK